ncbi:MAG: aminotransferase class IV [Bacillota bacterium]
MENLVYLDGQLLPASEARIAAADYGFLYGYGLFETLRVYQGKPFMAKEHLERLQQGSALLDINLTGTVDLGQAMAEIIAANIITDGSLRLTISRKAGAPPWDMSDALPTIYLSVSSHLTYAAEQYQKGFRAVTASFRRNEKSPLAGIKSLNFLENVLAKREAKAAGLDEAILLNTAGLVAEGSTSNLFIVDRYGKLITPPATVGLLPGITRQAVMELACKYARPCAEQPLSTADVYQAAESFLTSSIMEIMPLVELDGHTIGSGRPGPMTRLLSEFYKSITA